MYARGGVETLRCTEYPDRSGTPQRTWKRSQSKSSAGLKVRLCSSEEKEEFCEPDDKATRSTDLGICGGFSFISSDLEVGSDVRRRFVYVYLRESIESQTV